MAINDQAYLEEFLGNSASRSLVEIFDSASESALASDTSIQLAHVAASPLDDATVRDRVSPEVDTRARGELARQILELPRAGSNAGRPGFNLSGFGEPARE